MPKRACNRNLLTCLVILGISGVTFMLASACNNNAAQSTNDSNTTTSEDNILLTPAKSYEGSISGKVFESQTTRASFDGDEAGQALPLSFESGNTSVRFTDLDGNDLFDPDGHRLDDVPLQQVAEGPLSVAHPSQGETKSFL